MRLFDEAGSFRATADELVTSVSDCLFHPIIESGPGSESETSCSALVYDYAQQKGKQNLSRTELSENTEYKSLIVGKLLVQYGIFALSLRSLRALCETEMGHLYPDYLLPITITSTVPEGGTEHEHGSLF
jgi:hypothetical protein